MIVCSSSLVSGTCDSPSMRWFVFEWCLPFELNSVCLCLLVFSYLHCQVLHGTQFLALILIVHFCSTKSARRQTRNEPLQKASAKSMPNGTKDMIPLQVKNRKEPKTVWYRPRDTYIYIYTQTYSQMYVYNIYIYIYIYIYTYIVIITYYSICMIYIYIYIYILWHVCILFALRLPCEYCQEKYGTSRKECRTLQPLSFFLACLYFLLIWCYLWKNLAATFIWGFDNSFTNYTIRTNKTLDFKTHLARGVKFNVSCLKFIVF